MAEAVVVAALAMAGAALGIAPERQAQLEHMVVQDCGSCHGLTMKGGLGRPITPGALAGRDPGVLAAIILDGVPGSAMPPSAPARSMSAAIRSRSPGKFR